MKMTGRNEKELEGVSLLGNQNNVYRADYVLNLPAFVQKPDSLILLRSIFHMFRVNAW